VGVLVWWLLPLLATIVAIVWLWWKGRTGAGEPGQVRSTKELERMRKAIEKPLPQKVERNSDSDSAGEGVPDPVAGDPRSGAA